MEKKKKTEEEPCYTLLHFSIYNLVTKIETR